MGNEEGLCKNYEFSAQFFCETKSALKNKVYLFMRLDGMAKVVWHARQEIQKTCSALLQEEGEVAVGTANGAERKKSRKA